jgi:hemolysin III
MIKVYTKREEMFNSISHGAGVIFGIAALSVMLVISIKSGDVSKIVAFSVYGACIIAMYLSSTLYHSVPSTKMKSILRVLDHSSIFLFIAGTYTPVLVLALNGGARWGYLIAIWSVALGGIIFKIATYGKFDRYKAVSLALYIGMGWLAILPIKMIIDSTSWGFFGFILAGGILYSLGTIFYAVKKIPYNHGIWHLFVLSASILHFVGIMLYLG